MGFVRNTRRISAGPDEYWATAGRQAVVAWLGDRKLPLLDGTPWHVEIKLDVRREPALPTCDETSDTRFHIDIYPSEWGFLFCHAGRGSWIRVIDVAFVHGKDDFVLLTQTPSLQNIGYLLRALERMYRIQFQREHAFINTSIPMVEPALRSWVASL